MCLGFRVESSIGFFLVLSKVSSRMYAGVRKEQWGYFQMPMDFKDFKGPRSIIRGLGAL